jgi:hypothetical protein
MNIIKRFFKELWHILWFSFLMGGSIIGLGLLIIGGALCLANLYECGKLFCH